MSPPVSIAKKQGTVAIMGYSSVGKTTTLNAILKNNYSFISESKPTVGINHFRVNNNNISSQCHRNKARSAESTCTEILKDNKSHRLLPLGSKKRIAKKKVFDVLVSEAAFAGMEDTPLVFVDIPGIDFSNRECPYRHYVDEHFHTFDTIILVLDSNIAVKTQNRILRYIRKKLYRISTVPVIIVGNERSSQLTGSPRLSDLEVRVDEMFDIQSSDRVLQLDCIMSSFCGELDCGEETYSNDLEAGASGLLANKPIFVPVNLHDAFRYRLASANLNLGQVSQLGDSTIDKICQDEIGKQAWENLARHERLDIVHSALSTPGDDYKLLETNFYTFLAHLERVLREFPQHQLKAQSPVVMENQESTFFSLTNFFCRKDLPHKSHNGMTIAELRGFSQGLADTLSEISSRDSVLCDPDDVEICRASKTQYSDGTPETDAADTPVVEHKRRKWKNKKTAFIFIMSLVVLATIFAIIFVLFGYTIAAME